MPEVDERDLARMTALIESWRRRALAYRKALYSIAALTAARIDEALARDDAAAGIVHEADVRADDLEITVAPDGITVTLVHRPSGVESTVGRHSRQIRNRIEALRNLRRLLAFR